MALEEARRYMLSDSENRIRDYQHCYGGDCKTCPRWDKCLEEYLESKQRGLNARQLSHS